MANLIQFSSALSKELGAFIPPNWDQLSGYSGASRYVGVYWDSEHAVVMLDDGVIQKVSDGVWLSLLYNHAYSMAACQNKRPEKQGSWFVVDRQQKRLHWMRAKQAQILIDREHSLDSRKECLEQAIPVDLSPVADFAKRSQEAKAQIEAADDWFQGKMNP